MDPQLQENASLYVLDVLSRSERDAFEALLKQDPALAVEVAKLRDALFAPARSLQGTARPDLLVGIHQRLQLPTPETAPHRPLARFFSWSSLWAAAAIVLFSINLSLLWQLRQTASIPPPLASAATVSAVAQSDTRTTMAQSSIAQPDVTDGEFILRRNNQLSEEARRWEQAYLELAARSLPYFVSDSGLSRYTVVEMTPPQRHGLWVRNSEMAPEMPQVQPAVSRDSLAASAVAVWRDDEQSGVITIYNLPASARGFAPYLWVRANRAQSFVPVGYLPRLVNGCGSFSYSVDMQDFTPQEILISEEDSLLPGKQPSSRLLLVGPDQAQRR